MEFTLLGPIEAHQTRPPGYAAEVDWESLDLHRFERLFAAGRAALAEGDPGLASERLGEALGVFRDFWRTLDEELGIEPSAELKELERRILRQDPELDERRSPARRADVPGGHARPGSTTQGVAT